MKENNRSIIFIIILYALIVLSIVFLVRTFLQVNNLLMNIHVLITSMIILLTCLLILFTIFFGKNNKNTKEIEILDKSYNNTLNIIKSKDFDIHDISELFRQYCQVISKK